MKFGLAYEVQGPAADHHALIEETIEQCVYADEMGWDFDREVSAKSPTVSSPVRRAQYAAEQQMLADVGESFAAVDQHEVAREWMEKAVVVAEESGADGAAAAFRAKLLNFE